MPRLAAPATALIAPRALMPPTARKPRPPKSLSLPSAPRPRRPPPRPPRPPRPPSKPPSIPPPASPVFLIAFHILSSNFSFSLLCRSWSIGKGSRRFMAFSLDTLNLAARPPSLAARPSGDNKSLASFRLSNTGSTPPILPLPVTPLKPFIMRANAAWLADWLPPVKRPFSSRSRAGLLLPPFGLFDGLRVRARSAALSLSPLMVGRRVLLRRLLSLVGRGLLLRLVRLARRLALRRAARSCGVSSLSGESGAPFGACRRFKCGLLRAAARALACRTARVNSLILVLAI